MIRVGVLDRWAIRSRDHWCPHVIGYEKCCCGCPNLDPIHCRRSISRLRWVLIGNCGQHRERAEQ